MRRSPRAKRPRCKTCGGTGKMRVQVQPPGILLPATFKNVTCPGCQGTGRAGKRGEVTA